MKRRTFLKTTSAGSLGWSIPLVPGFSSLVAETRFGVAEASYYLRWYRDLPSVSYPPFTHALEMITHCYALGFGGVQVNVRGWDNAYAEKVGNRVRELDMFLEGQIRLPEDEEDLARFEDELSKAKKAGIEVLRTVCLPGRRYETFKSLQSFQAFRESSLLRLQMAEPLARRYRVKLAVENHKDWRSDGMLELLGKIDSEWVGVTLDTGNNIALLEDPMKVVDTLAPYAFSVHLKDMAVKEYEEGFLLSEVNLGEGYLDIEGMIRTIRKHQPEIRFNLEMITRDPLRVPCFTQKYWQTFDSISNGEFAAFLRDIKKQQEKGKLMKVSGMPTDEQLNLEVANNQHCLQYAKRELGFK